MKLHTGDTVVVITGKDKGRTGTILRVLPEENRVIVGGINIRTRHIRKSFDKAGRILRYEASIHTSNVMIIDPKTKKRSRIGFAIDAQGKKKRISKRSGEEVTKVKAEKKQKQRKKVSDASEASTSVTSETSATSAKAPFWKKMGFGASALEEAEVKEEPRSKQDQSIPDQQVHVRSGPRGS